tara:strand:+ start:5010 stop:5264 length:255 start_codon:yes stop_codon:yes gene_type:complete
MDAEIIRVAALAAVSTWGITEAVKPTVKKLSPDSWTRTGIRVAALIVGAGLGFCMKMDGTGAVAGAAGAALSAIIVATIKRRLK